MNRFFSLLGIILIILVQSNAKDIQIQSDPENSLLFSHQDQFLLKTSDKSDSGIDFFFNFIEKTDFLINKIKKNNRFLIGELFKINMDVQISTFLATVLFPEFLSERFGFCDRESLRKIGIVVPISHLILILVQKLPAIQASKIKNKLDSFSKLKPLIQVIKKAYSRYKKTFSANGYGSYVNDYVVLINQSLKADNLLTSICTFGFSTLLPDSFASKLGTNQKTFLQYVCLSVITACFIGNYLPDFIYNPVKKTLEFLSDQITAVRDTFGSYVQDLSPSLYAFFLNNCILLGDELKKFVGQGVIEKVGAPLLFAAAISGAVFTFKKCVSIKLLVKATANIQNILKFVSSTKSLYGSFLYAAATIRSVSVFFY